MESQPPLPPAPQPAPAGIEYCYRHPGAETRVHCTRCDRPICPECMIPAPVGHQCPECVGKARREFRLGAGPTARTRSISVTHVLIAANLAMFAAEVVVGGPNSLFQGPSAKAIVDLGAMYPPAIAAGGQYWRLFTSMFLHFGIIHIGFNMYALWLFGRVVERDYGSLRYALIYLIGGFFAGAASYAFGPVISVGAGASGAVFAVFGAFVAYNFRRRHLALAAANLRTAIMLIVINAFLAFAISGIDWRAHVGGLVAGLAAGTIADQVGPARLRPVIQVVGFVIIALVGVLLVTTRTAQLQSPGALFG
jgi:membrane associated rhomboid family serine protease